MRGGKGGRGGLGGGPNPTSPVLLQDPPFTYLPHPSTREGVSAKPPLRLLPPSYLTEVEGSELCSEYRYHRGQGAVPELP